MEREWSRLDNAGKIYPANVNLRNTTLFRFSVRTRTDVDEIRLQEAVDQIMPRFPYFHVHLSRGLFWYYFKKTDEQIRIREDQYYPCTEWDFKKSGFPFLVRYGKRSITLEFSHSLTDGTGALEFLKSLLLRYYKLAGINPADTRGIKVPGQKINKGEYSDAFREFYDVHLPSRKRDTTKAFHLNDRMVPKGVYRVTKGVMSTADLKKAAAGKELNITALICVIYLEVFQHIIYEKKARPAPIAVNLPVNLRNIFGSETMYNFFVSVTPSIDPRIGFFSEQDIIKHVKNYLSIEIDRRYVGKMIKRNIKIERNILIRIIPLFIKELLLPMVYNIWGERGYTSGVSNLGKIEFPPEIEEQIDAVDMIPPPSPGNLVKMLCYSYRGDFNIVFGSLSENRTVERMFFQRLRKLGVPIKIETIS